MFVIVGDPGLDALLKLEGTGPLVQPQGAHHSFGIRIALQRGARVEELGGKGLPQRVGRIDLGDPCDREVAGHAVADLLG